MKQREPYDQDADDVEPLPPFCTERHPRTGVCCFGDVGHLDDHKSSALTGEQTWPREPTIEPVPRTWCWHVDTVIQHDGIDHSSCPGPHGIMWAAR